MAFYSLLIAIEDINTGGIYKTSIQNTRYIELIMVASSKVSSKVSYSTSTTDEESIDEQYSTLLQDLFSFRKQDPNLFHTLMESLHHQGVHEQQRRCDLDTFDNDNHDYDKDDDVIERLRIINDKREDMNSSTNAADKTKANSSKKSSKKMQAKTMIEGEVPRLFKSESANIYYNAMKAKNNVPNKPANTVNMIKSSKKKISWAEKKTNMSKLELLNLQLALESIKVE